MIGSKKAPPFTENDAFTGRVVSLVVLGSVALGLAGAAWALVRFWRLAAIGSAYKAKILCTAVFGAGRDLDPRRAPEVSSDSYWILRFFRAHIDRDRRSVTVSLAGLRSRLAVYRDGLGARSSRALMEASQVRRHLGRSRPTTHTAGPWLRRPGNWERLSSSPSLNPIRNAFAARVRSSSRSTVV
jgi:hypothetical protein